jgi:hypothetical protein
MNTWTAILILCAFCSLLSNQWLEPTYVEFIPSALLCEATLIFLCRRYPFPVRLSFLRLAFFPSIGIWLPYVIRLLFGHPGNYPFNELIKQKLGIELNLQIAKPGQVENTNGVIETAYFCLGCTAVVVVTSLFFGSRHVDVFEPAHYGAYKRQLRTKSRKKANVGSDTRSKQIPESGGAPETSEIPEARKIRDSGGRSRSRSGPNQE